MAKVTFVDSPDGDWEGMYIDDELVYEGHSVSGYTAATHLEGLAIESVTRFTVDSDWISDVGNLPETLAEATLHKKED